MLLKAIIILTVNFEAGKRASPSPSATMPTAHAQRLSLPNVSHRAARPLSPLATPLGLQAHLEVYFHMGYRIFGGPNYFYSLCSTQRIRFFARCAPPVPVASHATSPLHPLIHLFS